MTYPATFPWTFPIVFGEEETANELTYFTVEGFYGDVENPVGVGSSIQPNFGVVSATVTFLPRVPTGTVLFIPNLDLQNGVVADAGVPITPIQARIINGLLQTINRADTPNVQLLAFTSIISTAFSQQNLGGELIYDVQFSNVQFAGGPQVINNFGIIAPTSATTISLTDPGLARIPYAGSNVPYVLP